jgi:Domain of Unknown Function with PDB structure (DUF3857)
MMNKAFCAIIGLLFSLVNYAQKLSKFGLVELADLKATSCTYQKNVPAEILIDEGETKFEWNSRNNFFKMETYKRIRIKILNQKGLDYANIKLKYLSDDRYEKIENIIGYTYNIENDKIIETKLDKKLVYQQTLNDQVAQISFGMPNVKVGSIIEYKYIAIKESFSNIDPWEFQNDIPTRISKYTLEIPEYFRFTANIQASQVVDKKENSDTRSLPMGTGTLRMGVTSFSYTIKEIKSLVEEPFMGSLNDYKQKLIFQLSEIILPNDRYSYTTSWEALAKELREKSIFGEQLKKNVPIPALDNAVKALPTTIEKVKLIYTYFKNNYEWTGTEDFYCLNVKKIGEDKKGSTGDLNLLFLNKLKDYDIEAYPLLVSTKEHGMVNTIYPFLKQFNTVMAFIPIGEKNYIINAADKYNSYNLIPYNAINTKALKLYKSNSNWVDLVDEKMIAKQIVSYKAEVDESGLITGSSYINCNGYSKPPRLEKFQKDKSNFIDYYYKNNTIIKEVKDLVIQNELIDSLGLEQQFKFTSGLVNNDDYQLLYYNLFNNLKENPFINEERVSDIDFMYARHYNLKAHFTVAPNFEFEELPKNIKMIMPDTGIIFERTIFKDDNTISISFNYKIIKPYYYNSDYPDLQVFYKKLYELLEEPIVLKRKK